ncbi:hypothetical protein M9H77_11832 [Catharanthus roseus]|uniref:Uncharacterized protein n=1 Tax=Catharanthus roseus TaxID=4058 RepID=A0ACC0BFV9_CATRO|nr:hypothetical protein M9H77_11832 [Catharanthus roseus]
MTRDAQEIVELLQEGSFRGTKTLLFSKLQVEEAKKISLEDLESSKSNGEEDLNPIAASRVHLPSMVGSRHGKRKDYLPPTVGVNFIIMYGIKNYRREYEEYHEGCDHVAYTPEGYNFGAYGRNGCNKRTWRSFHFPYSLGAYLERRYFIEFNSISCAIPRVDDYDFNIANCVSCVLVVEDRRNMEKEIGPILEHLSISLSLNPSSLCYEVSLEELISLLDSHTFQISLIGDIFLDVDHMLKYSSPCAFLEKQLFVSIARIRPSYHDLELLHDNLLFDRLIANVTTSCASMWIEIVLYRRTKDAQEKSQGIVEKGPFAPQKDGRVKKMQMNTIDVSRCDSAHEMLKLLEVTHKELKTKKKGKALIGA